MLPYIFSNLAFTLGYDYVTDDISSPDYIYIGLCKPGTSKSSAGWMIIRVTTTRPETFRWANAKALDATFIWNSRDSYTYAA